LNAQQADQPADAPLGLKLRRTWTAAIQCSAIGSKHRIFTAARLFLDLQSLLSHSPIRGTLIANPIPARSKRGQTCRLRLPFIRPFIPGELSVNRHRQYKEWPGGSWRQAIAEK